MKQSANGITNRTDKITVPASAEL